MTADTTLKPCPFCAASADLVQQTSTMWNICCSGCGAESRTEYGRQAAIAAWNRRVPHAALAAAKAARWDWVCRHWKALNVRFNKDGRTLKRIALSVDANAQGAAGSPRLDILVDQAIGEEAARGSTSPSKPKPTPCRPHLIYRGPSNCKYGTVGCLEPGHRDSPRPTGAPNGSQE